MKKGIKKKYLVKNQKTNETKKKINNMRFRYRLAGVLALEFITSSVPFHIGENITYDTGHYEISDIIHKIDPSSDEGECFVPIIHVRKLN